MNAASPSSCQGTLLLVDDRPDNLFVLEQLIAEHLPGCATVSAHNAPEGLALAARREFDGMLVDVQMPDMDGIEMCRRLKADPRTARVPVVLVTAQGASAQLRVQGLEAGADDFLSKPIASDELIARIKVMLRIKRAEDELRAANRELEARVAQRTREVRESEARYRALVDCAADHIFTLDRDGVFLFSNDRLCGMKVDGSLVGRRISEFYPPDTTARYLNFVTTVLATGRPVRFEHDVEVEGQVRHHLDTLYPIAQGDKAQTAGGICRDITEQKHAEEERQRLQAQLMQSQRLEALGVLAGGVAHEINNPLHAILSYAELILDGLPADNPNRSHATEITRETERIATVVRNLLAFAKPAKQGRTPERIRDVVENTLSFIRTIVLHDSIVLRIDVPEDLPPVPCRSHQIAQVVMNLVTNARDALNARYPAPHPEKVLLISARAFTRDGVRWVRLTVEDRGVGIDAGMLPHIFDPFFTTKHRAAGTGLGLSICHGIVREHGGEIHAESVPGQFTRVHLDLRADESRR